MKYLLPLLVAFLIPATFARAQENRLINTHNWAYVYIHRLQQRGHLLQLNPTDLPYTFGDIHRALKSIDTDRLSPLEKSWVELLKRRFAPRPLNVDSMRVGLVFGSKLRRSSTARLNVINPRGEGKPVLPRAYLRAYLEWKNWIGQAGITFDWFYDVDPVGLDQARRLYIRSEEVYFGYNGEYIEFYIGRFDNHWSVFGRKGAFLTDNPRSFDQIQLTFGTSTLSFSSILGELDNMAANGTFTGHAFDLGAVRRYVFLHRIDWSPIPNLKLSFIEAQLYSSPTAGIQIRSLIPLHFLFFESGNKPMNNNSNIMLGGGIWYHTGSWTFYFQGMIDDVDISSGEKVTFTLNSSITVVDVANRFDLGLEVDMVSANAYRTTRYQDQWTYAQRGLATNFSDFIRVNLSATFYPRFLTGLTVRPAVTVYWKGTAGLRGLIPKQPIPTILVGTVERTVRPSLYLRYQPLDMQLFGESGDVRVNFWMDANIGINFVSNYRHDKGDFERRFIGLFRIFAEVTF